MNDAPRESVGRWAFLIGAGVLATTLPQTYVIDLPVRRLLLEDLHVSRQAMALFFALIAIPWYIKPLAGLVTDSFPLFGTRRRHYLILSALAAGALWLVAGWSAYAFWPLLLASMAMNTMLVIGSTVVGGLLAEVGQRLGAAGRLSAARVFVDDGCAVLAGPIAGALASLPFMLAAVVGGAIAVGVVPIALVWLREPATAIRRAGALAEGWERLRTALRSRELWFAAALLFVASMPQAFHTPLYFFQTQELGLAVETVGYLKGIYGVGAVSATAVYAILCRYLPLRVLLPLGMAAGAVAVLAHLAYRSLPAAMVVAGLDGFLATTCTLALMQVSVLAAPAASAAMSFALLMSAWNLGDALGDVLAAALIERWSIGFFGLIGIYGAAMVAMLAVLRHVPRALFSHSERAARPA